MDARLHGAGLEIPPFNVWMFLTWTRDPGCGQCLVGSLTGAVSS